MWELVLKSTNLAKVKFAKPNILYTIHHYYSTHLDWSLAHSDFLRPVFGLDVSILTINNEIVFCPQDEL